MYKSRLQELCHQKSWNLPEYTATKQGPDHNPRFQATVTVCNLSFTTSNLCRSSKEAQNNAARMAFEHLTSPSLPKPSPSPPAVSSVCGASSVQMNIQQIDETPQVSATASVVKDDYRFRDQTPQVNATTLVGKDVFGSRDQTLLVNATDSAVKDVYRSQGSLSANTLQMNIQQTDQTPQVGATTSVVEDDYKDQTPQVNAATIIGKDVYKSRDQTPLVSATSSFVQDVHKSRDTLHLYKNQLQSYAQKRNLVFPLYSCEREGPPHASRFKGKVTVDGQTYESREFFPTLKEAEHAAAKVALMSLSPDGVQEDDSGLYKNLLQELAQKEGYSMPVYHTNRSGEAHLPTFVSTVEVEREVFTGQEAKTKKQAEMNAAKVAYLTLKECKSKQRPTVLSTSHQAQSDYASSSSPSNLSTDLPQKVQPTGHMVLKPSPIQAEQHRVNGEVGNQHFLDTFPQPVIINRKGESSPSDPSAPSIPENAPSSSWQTACSSNVIPESSVGLANGTDTSSSSQIRVCPRMPNMIFPDGGRVLRIDDNWIAIKLGSKTNQ